MKSSRSTDFPLPSQCSKAPRNECDRCSREGLQRKQIGVRARQRRSLLYSLRRDGDRTETFGLYIAGPPQIHNISSPDLEFEVETCHKTMNASNLEDLSGCGSRRSSAFSGRGAVPIFPLEPLSQPKHFCGNKLVAPDHA